MSIFQAGAAVATGLASRINGAAANSFMTPLGNAASYVANDAIRTQLPNVDDIFRAYQQRLASPRAMGMLHGVHGRIGEFNAERYRKYTWRGNLELAINPDWYNASHNVWDAFYKSQGYTPSIDEILHLFRRQLMSRDVAAKLIAENCGGSDIFAMKWLDTVYEIPGASDLVRFAVREAFDTATIQQYGYHKEFPKEILSWMEKQGYGQDIGMARPVGATDNVGNAMGGNATWSDLYWYSHWELPSLSQGYEMLHRLYPASRYGISPNAVGGNTFDPDNLSALQKAQDIPEYWRNRLQAISYNPPTRVDTQRMYFDDIINKAKVYHNLRATGYNDTDANDMTEWLTVRKEREKLKKQQATSSDYVCKHLTIGTISIAKAREILTNAGYVGKDIDAFIEKCLLNVQTDTLKSALSVIRGFYLKGQISDLELAEQLTRLRVSDYMIDQYLTRWRYQRDYKYKLASLGELRKAYKNRLISDTDLTTALTNLGYSLSEQYTIVNNVRVEMAERSVKAARAEYKALLARNKEVAKATTQARKESIKNAKNAIKVQETKASKQLRGLVAAASDKNIDLWYNQGLISIRDIALRYLLKYWAIPDIQRRIYSMDSTLDTEFISGEIKKAQKVFVSLGFAPPIEPTSDGMLPIGQKPADMSGKGKRDGKGIAGESGESN